MNGVQIVFLWSDALIWLLLAAVAIVWVRRYVMASRICGGG